jgi:signal transduction histidine kinase
VSGIVSALLTKTFRSSTLKLALICIGIFGAVVLALFSYVYWSSASYVRSQSDHIIAAEQAILRDVYARAGRDGLIAAIRRRSTAEHFEGALYLLADPSFAPLAGNLDGWPSALRDPHEPGRIDTREWSADEPDRPMMRAMFETLADGSHLLVGKQIGDIDAFTGRIRTALAGGALLLAVLAAAMSVAVTRRTVGRIESINTTSRAIMESGLGTMESGLGTRIPLRGSRDEWDQVAENLNLMLDRIEALMGEVKQATDNVAHDLRTPLARMRGRLEKASNRSRDDKFDQALIGDTIADLDAVLGIFSSLTRISQIEVVDRKIAFRSVDLAEIASKVVELFDAAAEDRQGHLRITGHQRVLVTGDGDLLFDALANLVDNAIKHGPEGGEVIVDVAHDQDSAVLSVADNGAGIPANEHQHVFKRFYRLERSRSMPGNGLGLSLVTAVARLHGARTEMVDNLPGLKFRLVFPLPATARSEVKAVTL